MMKRMLKIILWSGIGFITVGGLLFAGFLYKVKHGFLVSYETQVPSIDFPSDRRTVLLFSKSTGFRHGESIEAGKKAFAELARKNNWFLYSTEEGGVFNPEQLTNFDVVIFNNSTGRVLNDTQQTALENYVEQGGSLIGIHGSGDDSHHWEWYEQNLTGVRFSHHPIDPQLQQTTVMLNAVPETLLTQGLPRQWTHTDEWYIFFENPGTKGFHVLYTIDGAKIIPGGNFLWIKDKDFGMGKDHPVSWYRPSGRGRTFYTSMGHQAEAWEQPAFVQMLENAVGSR